MDDKYTFEEAMSRLEEIVKALETGKASLDDSLELFEEGVKLVRFCNGNLENAELKIKKLTASKTGDVSESDFETV